MLSIIIQVFDDGVETYYHVLKHHQNTIELKVESLDKLEKDNVDSNYIIGKTNLTILNKVPVLKMFRKSYLDIKDRTFNEQGTLFDILDKLTNSEVLREDDWVKFNYVINNKLDDIIINDNVTANQDKLSEILEFKASTVPDSVKKYGDLREDVWCLDLNSLNVTNIKSSSSNNFINKELLYNLYMYTVIPEICIRLIKIKLKEQYGVIINPSTLFEFKYSLVQIMNSCKELKDYHRQLNNKAKEELLSELDILSEEYNNRKKLLFKIRYLYNNIALDDIFIKTSLGKLEVKLSE